MLTGGQLKGRRLAARGGQVGRMEGAEGVQSAAAAAHPAGKVGQRIGVAGPLEGLGLPTRPILVVRMIAHVLGPDPLGLVDKGPLLRLREDLPLGAEPLGDLGVVHLGVLLGDLASLHPGPDHEGVHRPLDVVLQLLVGHDGGMVMAAAAMMELAWHALEAHAEARGCEHDDREQLITSE
jgi:hypothetical protein